MNERRGIMERGEGMGALAWGVGAALVWIALAGGCMACSGCKRTGIRIPRPPAVEVAR